MNKALKERASQLYSQKKEESSKDFLLKGKPRIAVLQSNTPIHFTILSDEIPELTVHLVFETLQTGKTFCKTVICDSFYNSLNTCELCELTTVNDKGTVVKANRPINMKFIRAYNHSNEGKTWSKDGKEYPSATVQYIPVRAGKDQANFVKMDNLNRKNMFKPGKAVFQIEKTGKGINTVYECPRPVRDDELGDEFDPHSAECKAAQELHKNITEDEVWGDLLLNLTNVDWETFGIDKPTEDDVESREVTPSKKSKNDLD